jgi:hypothetical protein
MFLTKSDLEKLTGFKSKKLQQKQLTLMGIPFRVNARDEPIVCVCHITGNKEQPSNKSRWQSNL